MSSAESSAPTFVGGRRVVHVRGTKTQTVSVCTPSNQVGRYEVRYRLPIGVDLTAADLNEVPDLDELRLFLLGHNGVPEDPGAAQVSRLPPLVGAPSARDPWLAEARVATERAVIALVDEFRESPYLHRVEHSLHARLYELLVSEPSLGQRTEMASGEVTQLVHKEWPETMPRRTNDTVRPRGLFDLVILSPAQVREANLEQLRTGRISAPIVIEVGLDYGLPHLQQDLSKLENSKVHFPYVLHLSRIAVRDQQQVEATLTAPNSKYRTAYVHHDPLSGSLRYKHVNQDKISVT